MGNGGEAGLVEDAGEGVTGVEGFAIDVAECRGAGAIAFEGVGQFCGGLAHLFVGIIDSGFMADRLIERCQVLGLWRPRIVARLAH